LINAIVDDHLGGYQMIRLIAIFFAVSFLSATAEAQVKRVALVIGNAAYVHAGILANPTNDATDIGSALTKHGFQVLQGFDLNKVGRQVPPFPAV
jgi:hypothetical protein